MADITNGQYAATINEAQGTVTITDGNGSLTMFMAEGDKAKQAVAFASAMLDMEVVPPYISFTPFRIEFTESATYLSNPKGRVKFDKASFEALVSIIGDIVHKAADQIRIRGGARAGVSGVKTPEPVF